MALPLRRSDIRLSCVCAYAIYRLHMRARRGGRAMPLLANFSGLPGPSLARSPPIGDVCGPLVGLDPPRVDLLVLRSVCLAQSCPARTSESSTNTACFSLLSLSLSLSRCRFLRAKGYRGTSASTRPTCASPQPSPRPGAATAAWVGHVWGGLLDNVPCGVAGWPARHLELGSFGTLAETGQSRLGFSRACVCVCAFRLEFR